MGNIHSDKDLANLLFVTMCDWRCSAESDLVIRVGTVCSGSELYMAVFRHLEVELLARYDLRVIFKHEWSCEIKAEKRQWIHENFSPAMIFGDVVGLAKTGTAHDYVSGELRRATPVDLVIAGTSCKDASRLHMKL